MTARFYTLLLGATLLATPAFAQDSSTPPTAPTAGSAAAQVGQTPPAALDENGKRVEPSQKLWNNPRTEAEQPGTQPPPNDRPANSAESTQQSASGQHAEQTGKHKHGKHAHHKASTEKTETPN
ncbi:hypothetical protein GOB86_06715 [Acetobacter lambici]|uniref:Uncharacterized protein n=1 Tax=Acetobacter lambici TaxID=1332824 RepID=A0ABT1EZ39_9PROT|nr:hypothetical protein [Acetobacter lambici]MCP1242203.1 hypothetical protein [Acetobacter lambici]MCP1258220.1 hypothetical protein [Acetobacter lambici]NHO56759.1 hypothetical protein [Acetobacter lambici]